MSASHSDALFFLPLPATLVIAGVTLFRIFAASRIPLEGDEAYYWIWSLHPAFGYTDHPPMVAWLVAAASFLGGSPLAIRLPFILCEGIAALAAGRAAIALTGSTAAGAAAAIALALIPQHRLMIGEAQPDAPYVMFWALALLFAARAAQFASRRDVLMLGVTLGGALLTRFFSWALVAGVAAYALTKNGARLRRHAWIAVLVAVALYAPYLSWNAAHGWAGFAFALVQRERWVPHFDEAPFIRFTLLTIVLIGLTIVTTRPPRLHLLGWTALPMLVALEIFSLSKDVETWWLIGPFVSLCLALGVAIARMRPAWRITLAAIWGTAAIWTMGVVALAALALPSPLYVRDFAFKPLAADARAISARTGAAVFTNRYEIASQLRYGGVEAYMIGDEPQIRAWNAWYGTPRPRRALIIALYPIGSEPQLVATLRRFCRRTARGPALTYTANRTSTETFYLEYCEN